MSKSSNMCFICQKPSDRLIHQKCESFTRPQDRNVTRHAMKASLLPTPSDTYYGFIAEAIKA